MLMTDQVATAPGTDPVQESFPTLRQSDSESLRGSIFLLVSERLQRIDSRGASRW